MSLSFMLLTIQGEMGENIFKYKTINALSQRLFAPTMQSVFYKKVSESDSPYQWYKETCTEPISIKLHLIGMSHEYTECQTFCPVVRIGSPPHPQASGAPPPPLGPSRETHSLAGRGWGDPIPTKGQTLWYSTVCIIQYNRSTLFPFSHLRDSSFSIQHFFLNSY